MAALFVAAWDISAVIRSTRPRQNAVTFRFTAQLAKRSVCSALSTPFLCRPAKVPVVLRLLSHQLPPAVWLSRGRLPAIWAGVGAPCHRAWFTCSKVAGTVSLSENTGSIQVIMGLKDALRADVSLCL